MPRYYPRVNMTFCGSSPWRNTLLTALGIESLYPSKKSLKSLRSTDIIYNQGDMFEAEVVESPEHLQNMTVAEVIDSINWKDENVAKKFESDLIQGDHATWCMGIPSVPLLPVST